jgi:hypothetical protein
VENTAHLLYTYDNSGDTEDTPSNTVIIVPSSSSSGNGTKPDPVLPEPILPEPEEPKLELPQTEKPVPQPTRPRNPDPGPDRPTRPPTDHTLIPIEGGYIDIGPDGLPLGEWQWDEPEEMWIFTPYPPLGVPQTGNPSPAPWLLGFAAISLGITLGYRKKQTS